MQHQRELTFNEIKKAMTVIDMLTSPNEQIWDFVYYHLLSEVVKYSHISEKTLFFTDDENTPQKERMALVGSEKTIFKKPPPTMIWSFIMLSNPPKNYINVE